MGIWCRYEISDWNQIISPVICCIITHRHRKVESHQVSEGEPNSLFWEETASVQILGLPLKNFLPPPPPLFGALKCLKSHSRWPWRKRDPVTSRHTKVSLSLPNSVIIVCVLDHIPHSGVLPTAKGSLRPSSFPFDVIFLLPWSSGKSRTWKHFTAICATTVRRLFAVSWIALHWFDVCERLRLL